MGYLAPAMVNYLALLGWNDGSEDEIFTVDQISKFTYLFYVTCASFRGSRYSFLEFIQQTRI